MSILDWMKKLAFTGETSELPADSGIEPMRGMQKKSTSAHRQIDSAEDKVNTAKPIEAEGLTERDMKSAEVGGLNFMEAIQAHQKWKSRLSSYLNGESSEKLDYRQICRDNQCVLGKWINGQGSEIYGHIPAFSQLKMAHGQFHLAAGSIVQMTDEGNFEQARAALRQDYSKHSIKVQGLISTLYIEVIESKTLQR